MIRVDVAQGSPEWFSARLGIPTASCFGKILTSQGKPSTSATTYMNELLADWMIGEPEIMEPTEWMVRGTEMEAEAREYFSFTHSLDFEETGVIYKDESKLISCSPDGISDDIGLEVKCPQASTHVGYLLANKIPAAYIPQVQGSMYVTGFSHWYFISYHPKMEPLVIKAERDDEYIGKLDAELQKFVDKMLKKRKQLKPDEAVE